MTPEEFEELTESDSVVINYEVPKYTPKEQLITYSLVAGVSLAAIGAVMGTAKLLEKASDAWYHRRQKKLLEAEAAKLEVVVTDDQE